LRGTARRQSALPLAPIWDRVRRGPSWPEQRDDPQTAPCRPQCGYAAAISVMMPAATSGLSRRGRRRAIPRSSEVRP
jgi:hypothetical protein